MTKRIVAAVLIAVVGGLSLWDVVLATDDELGNTISEVLRSRSKEHPIIAFCLGVLIGHWYW